MARHAATRRPINTPLQKGRKATQRQRILAGMITAANREGYVGANVSAVIEQAGVSRPTFYEYFKDRDACFVASIADVQERLLDLVDAKVQDGPPERAVAGAAEAMVDFATTEPAMARFLMKEALAGGPVALDARDEGIEQTAKLVEATLAAAGPTTAIPDIPIAAVLGAVQRLLATRLRRGERVLAGFQQDVIAWISSYEAPAAAQRWRTPAPAPEPPTSPFLPRTTLRAPAPLPPGRPLLSEEEVAENHRQRIMFATSQVVAERGYTAATISEITRRAGVDSREFYRFFADKQEAFSAIHEIGFQYLMAVTAGAFFGGSDWPERIWEAYRAATQSVQENPTVAHVGFVESYAVGARGIQRVEDSRIAFTIFLQEGYRYDPARKPPSRTALEAIIAAIFEISYRETRGSAEPQTSGLLAPIAHLCLAPFMGVAESNAFIDAKLAETAGAKKNTARQPRRTTQANTGARATRKPGGARAARKPRGK